METDDKAKSQEEEMAYKPHSFNASISTAEMVTLILGCFIIFVVLCLIFRKQGIWKYFGNQLILWFRRFSARMYQRLPTVRLWR